MLDTALRTSQQRVLGTAILQWDTFSLESLDVCQVMFFNFIEKHWQNQFPTTILSSSFIILDQSLYILESFGILTYFWKLLDTFGIYWRFVGDLSSGFHQLSSVIFSKYVQF